jgi:hypothetical protein
VSIAEPVDRLGLWVTRFTIDGHDDGGGDDASHDAAERIADFHPHVLDVTAILELGPPRRG